VTSEEPEPEAAGDDRDRFAGELEGRLSGLSGRQLAERSGWGRSTIGDIKSGKRLPSEEQLRDLLQAVGAEEVELGEWGERLKLLAPVPPRVRLEKVDASTTQPHPPAEGWNRRLLVGALVLSLVAVGFAAGYAVGVTRPNDDPNSDGSDSLTPSGNSAVTGDGTTPAVIANTEGLGVTTYREPRRDRGKRGALAEGAPIKIVCQVGDGEIITDKVNGERLAWPVWDKLDDGSWVPDIYTSLSKLYTPSAGRTSLMTC
jgi:transcriptional regulator with XRE-family HTH domain